MTTTPWQGTVRPSLEHQYVLVQARLLNDIDQALSCSVSTHQAAGVLEIAAVCELPCQFPLIFDAIRQFTRHCLRYAFLGVVPIRSRAEARSLSRG